MNLLEVKNVCKTYGSKETAVNALKNVSFSVPKGEYVAIVGESGSGKSTLLNMIGALDIPTAGKVLIDGMDIFSMNDQKLTVFRRRNIGFIFQAFNLIPEFTVEQNITFRNKEEQMAFYKATDMSVWVADPNGVNTGGWGLTLSPMDMAKIGELIRKGGVYDRTRIVSEEWVRESTSEQSRWAERNLPYGYLWWILEQEHGCAAMGDGGNIIYINLDRNMVVAIASRFKPTAKDRIKLIRQYVEPAF